MYITTENQKIAVKADLVLELPPTVKKGTQLEVEVNGKTLQTTIERIRKGKEIIDGIVIKLKAPMPKKKIEGMIELMQDGQWYSAEVLAEQITHRFGATMHSLKKKYPHLDFDKRKIGNTFEYRLIKK